MSHSVQTAAAKAGRFTRVKDWQIVLLAPAVTVLLCFIPRFFNNTFFYWDDTMQSFLPVWRSLGQELLSGNFEMMDPGGWVGGNYIAEVGYGIWNPLNLVNFMLVAGMNDLALASAIVVVEFMALLALGATLLTRSYGANRWLAAAAGIAIPFSGFTLFYEAARWPGGLMAFAWTTLFWWALRRWFRSNRSPFVPFILGFLTMTAGNPYGALGVIIVCGAVSVEMLLTRHGSKVIPLFFLALAVGLTAVLVFFPLPLSSEVTVRTDSVIANDMFLVPGIGDLTAMSTPNFRPPTANFWGNIDVVPSAYLAWFVLPLMPWLNFRSIARRSRQMSSLYVVTATYFLLSFAPSNVLLFRWPIRLVEYAYLGFLILFMVVLSAGLSRKNMGTRLVVSGAIILFGLYRAWAIYPDGFQSQLVGSALIALLLVLALFLWKRAGFPGLASAMVLGTALVLTFQSYAFVAHNPVAALGSPVDADVLEESAKSYSGNTLQIFSTAELDPEAFVDGSLLYGNQILNAGVEDSLNRYSGISFVTYANALCMNYRGETCPWLYDVLWEPASDDVTEPLADALRLETIVVQKSARDIQESDVPDGWAIVESDEYRVVLGRQEPFELPGSVSWATPGIHVDAAEENGDSETVHINAESDGTLGFARLAWPGYTVAVDGVEQELEQGPAGLISVDVPAGATEIDLDFTPPGLTLGLAAMAAGWTLALGLTVLHYWRRRRTPVRSNGK
ncbi:hypothetical protein H9638_10395 [Arthrobacter sp. Sa2BUA2]|uniref:YfhO family protein n=1 Tax=Arthrobacter pullicola TaxID=2762224 RepID=A0ABR8YJ25_9MICC|nr:hypothetical protein [Arthrobacter pullicola]MBD8044215.1 hypothetical protein [Arthrobacter pullicola]